MLKVYILTYISPHNQAGTVMAPPKPAQAFKEIRTRRSGPKQSDSPTGTNTLHDAK